MALSKGRRPPDHLLMTKVEVARTLSLPLSAINRLIWQGILEPATPEGERPVRFHVRDVSAVLEAVDVRKKVHLSKIWNTTLVSYASVKRLERKLDDVLLLLGAKEEALSTDQVDVERFFHKVTKYLKSDLRLLSVDDVFWWARTFIQMDERYLQIAAHFLETKEPWLQPLLLGQKMLEQAPRELFGERKDLQDVYGYLECALRSFRHSAYFYCRILLGSAKEANAKFPEIHAGNATRTIARLIAMGMPDNIPGRIEPQDRRNRRRMAKPRQGRPLH